MYPVVASYCSGSIVRGQRLGSVHHARSTTLLDPYMKSNSSLLSSNYYLERGDKIPRLVALDLSISVERRPSHSTQLAPLVAAIGVRKVRIALSTPPVLSTAFRVSTDSLTWRLGS